MVVNALSVGVAVMFTSLLLTRPLPQVPYWLQKVALTTNKTGPALKKESLNGLTTHEVKNELTLVTIADYDNIQELIDKVSETLCEIQKLTKRQEDMDKADDLETHWKIIASKLNKILCLIFSLVLVIMFFVAGILWVKV